MTDEKTDVAAQQPPVPGFALTYAVTEATAADACAQTPQGYGVRRHLRWAAIGIGVQILLAALVGIAALPFIEPLHSE